MSRLNTPVDPARLLAARVITETVFEGAMVGEASDRHLTASALLPEARAFATFLIFGTISYWLPLTYRLEAISREPLSTMSKYVQSVLVLGAFQLEHAGSVPAYAAVDSSVRLAAYFAGAKVKPLTNALLRRLSADPPAYPRRAPGLPFGWPNELFGVLRASYGENTALAIAEHSTLVQPWTTVRLNRRAAAGELPAGSLDPAIVVKPGRFAEGARRLLLKGRSPLMERAYAEGLMSLQNDASQLAVETALRTNPGSILDICAGHGGKTAALAEKAGPQAVTAVEIDPGKREQSEANLKRLGLWPLRQIEADATDDLAGVLGQRYDLVLCDVPCSGLGVTAKKPEIRLRMTYDRIQELLPLQAAILDRAAHYVAPGGHLFYLTCTHNRQENEAQADLFLAQHPEYRPACLQQWLPDALKDEAGGGFLNLFGHRHDVDGFFMAAFEYGGDDHE